jgi:hypothetical protein
MSYDHDEALARYERQESRKIGVALWPEQMINNTASGLLPDCKWCHRVLIASYKMPGKMMCPDCGNEYGPEPPKPKPKRFKPKQSTSQPNLIIATQQRKPRKKAQLGGILGDSDTELRSELEAMGIIDAQVTGEG